MAHGRRPNSQLLVFATALLGWQGVTTVTPPARRHRRPGGHHSVGDGSGGGADEPLPKIGPFPGDVFKGPFPHYGFYEGCFVPGQQIWQGHTHTEHFPSDNVRYCSLEDGCTGFHVYIRNSTKRSEVFIEYKRNCQVLPRSACTPPFGDMSSEPGAWYTLVNTRICPRAPVQPAPGDPSTYPSGPTKPPDFMPPDLGVCEDSRSWCSLTGQDKPGVLSCDNHNVRMLCPRACGLCDEALRAAAPAASSLRGASLATPSPSVGLTAVLAVAALALATVAVAMGVGVTMWYRLSANEALASPSVATTMSAEVAIRMPSSAHEALGPQDEHARGSARPIRPSLL